MADLLVINRRLKEYFGSDLTGKQHYRVVWSENLLEKRLGKFSDFYGDIFVRQQTEVREVPKYGYIKNRHILEKLVHFDRMKVPELIESDSYEPLYVFQDKDGKSLPVNYQVCQKIIHTLLYGEKIKLTDSDLVAEEKKELARESEYFEAELDKPEQIVKVKSYEGSIIVP